jgi:hypothetical protein
MRRTQETASGPVSPFEWVPDVVLRAGLVMPWRSACAPLARSVAGSCSPYSAHGSAETGHRVVTRWRDIPDTVRQGWAMDRV